MKYLLADQQLIKIHFHMEQKKYLHTCNVQLTSLNIYFTTILEVIWQLIKTVMWNETYWLDVSQENYI